MARSIVIELTDEQESKILKNITSYFPSDLIPEDELDSDWEELAFCGLAADIVERWCDDNMVYEWLDDGGVDVLINGLNG